MRNVRSDRLFLAYGLPGSASGGFFAEGQLTFTPILEPSTFALGAAGLVALGVVTRRKHPTA